jgi:hypothetical protein
VHKFVQAPKSLKSRDLSSGVNRIATFFRGGIRRFLPVDKITGCGSMRENQETQQTRQPEVAP